VRRRQARQPLGDQPVGSADLLEALGARIDLDAVAVARCIEQAGFGFMFAPRTITHALGRARPQPARVRTIFNFLGPLTNPQAPAAS